MAKYTFNEGKYNVLDVLRYISRNALGVKNPLKSYKGHRRGFFLKSLCYFHAFLSKIGDTFFWRKTHILEHFFNFIYEIIVLLKHPDFVNSMLFFRILNGSYFIRIGLITIPFSWHDVYLYINKRPWKASPFPIKLIQ